MYIELNTAVYSEPVGIAGEPVNPGKETPGVEVPYGQLWPRTLNANTADVDPSFADIAADGMHGGDHEYIISSRWFHFYSVLISSQFLVEFMRDFD